MSVTGERAGAGSGSRTRRWWPAVAGATAVVVLVAAPAVAASPAAVRTGLVQAWGTDQTDLSGRGYPSERHAPGAVALPAGVRARAVSTGQSHNVVIGSDRKLYAWGANGWGQLGDGTTRDRTKPVLVKLPKGVRPVKIAAGGRHTLMLGSDGKLYGWGPNGEIGIGKRGGISTTPVPVKLPAGVRAVSMAAGSHDLVIGSDDKLYAWGFNLSGQVGDGTTTNRFLPKVITLATGVRPVKVAVSEVHSLAIGSDKKLYAWGDNLDGALGVGDTKERHRPAVGKFPAGVHPVQIGAMLGSSIAIGSDRKIYGWGYGYDGVLADGNLKVHRHLTPHAGTFPAGVRPVNLVAGMSHVLAIGSNGKLYSWGNNSNGQLGDGSVKSRATPVVVKVPAKYRVFGAAAGQYRSVALVE